jgi:hypothetical protein
MDFNETLNDYFILRQEDEDLFMDDDFYIELESFYIKYKDFLII